MGASLYRRYLQVNLILIARRQDKLNELKDELEKKHSVQVNTIAKDLSLTGAGKELFNEIQSLGIQVDYLMNNAGFGLVGKFRGMKGKVLAQHGGGKGASAETRSVDVEFAISPAEPCRRRSNIRSRFAKQSPRVATWSSLSKKQLSLWSARSNH